MRKPALTRETSALFERRMDALRTESQPRWGTLNAPQMIKHLSGALQLHLSGGEFEDKSNLFSRLIVKPMILYVFQSMPKNIKAPDRYTPPSDGNFDRERAVYRQNLVVFLEHLEADPNRKAPHPVFGQMTLREWSILHGIHMDHHLRQFGV